MGTLTELSGINVSVVRTLAASIAANSQTSAHGRGFVPAEIRRQLIETRRQKAEGNVGVGSEGQRERKQRNEDDEEIKARKKERERGEV